MRTIDKAIFALLGISAVLLVAYGLTASTGFAIAVTGAAIGVGGLGTYFWGIMLTILIGLLVLLRIRSSNIERRYR